MWIWILKTIIKNKKSQIPLPNGPALCSWICFSKEKKVNDRKLSVLCVLNFIQQGKESILEGKQREIMIQNFPPIFG